eukprot:CAMPEP_0182851516 /NCGR_PEP_ID=MMETSP0006_2-20121128/30667_1 /TAXON_ID=97485 /ORGANISM="Prymnesium parvum, Strain Texoma1" /LENGTH=105 /DNA_ID=CAMNT_0024982189 /DNA_START=402 /DNA_END=716 /DNA_ORIENTATION=+
MSCSSPVRGLQERPRTWSTTSCCRIDIWMAARPDDRHRCRNKSAACELFCEEHAKPLRTRSAFALSREGSAVCMQQHMSRLDRWLMRPSSPFDRAKKDSSERTRC